MSAPFRGFQNPSVVGMSGDMALKQENGPKDVSKMEA